MSEEYRNCVLKINLNGVDLNLSFIKSLLKSNVQIMAIIKADGYGTDAIALAKFLAPKISYFGVAYVSEGVLLRKAGIKNPILVLHPQLNHIAALTTYNLEATVYSIMFLEALISFSRKSKNPLPVHLKFDTGLNRLGFSESQIPNLISRIKESSLNVLSIFSHLAASEDLNEKDFTNSQITRFKKIISRTKSVFPKAMYHLLNTSGIINYSSEASFDMVRTGIGLLGFGNEEKVTKQLHNVVQLTTQISQIKNVKNGESIGYNRNFITSKERIIAIVPFGHADGLFRSFGNGKGYMYINNKKAPIIGNVCMDMTLLDISDIDCKVGDTVYIFKNQPHIEDLAKRIETIPYELLTAISKRVGREIIKG